MMNLIDSVEDIKEPFLENFLEPARRVLGLYNSKVSNNWVSVVENATSVDHALDPIEKCSKGTEIELKCLNAFRYICRQGYQLALLIKTKDDEARKFEALLSPNAFERKKQVSISLVITISLLIIIIRLKEHYHHGVLMTKEVNYFTKMSVILMESIT